MKRGDTVRFNGVAAWIVGKKQDFYMVTYVGDDATHLVHKDDVAPLARDEYCGGCGQIGCGHGA